MPHPSRVSLEWSLTEYHADCHPESPRFSSRAEGSQSPQLFVGLGCRVARPFAFLAKAGAAQSSQRKRRTQSWPRSCGFERARLQSCRQHRLPPHPSGRQPARRTPSTRTSIRRVVRCGERLPTKDPCFSSQARPTWPLPSNAPRGLGARSGGGPQGGLSARLKPCPSKPARAGRSRLHHCRSFPPWGIREWKGKLVARKAVGTESLRPAKKSAGSQDDTALIFG